MKFINILIRLISRIIGCGGRCAPALLACLALCGCVQNERYVEGTMTQVGLYVPFDGNIFGCQVLNYLNGVSVQTFTNQNMVVSREYVSSNSYFGVITTQERSKTEVEVK